MLPVYIRWPRLDWLSSWPLTVALFSASMSGCAIVQPPAPVAPQDVAIYHQHISGLADIKHFNIQGRIGVQNDGHGFSGSVRWQHASIGDNIELFSPLGGQVATIRTTDEGVQLTDSDGKTYSASDAETLTQQTLGWSLPMQGLPDWVLGRTAHNVDPSIADALWDKDGKLTKLKQDGWEIEYLEYSEAASRQLPRLITLRSPKLYLKLIIKDWVLEPEVDGYKASTPMPTKKPVTEEGTTKRGVTPQ